MVVPFKDLFPKQKEVVKHRARSLLLLAGPGTGKTLVLAHRIAHLINEDVPPEEILAITFSRKAASQMAELLKDFKGLKRTQPRVSTLHAESLRILGEMDGSRRFLVADDEAQLLRGDAVQDVLGRYVGARKLKKWGDWIRLQKANNKLPVDIATGNIPSEGKQILLLKRLYERYEQLLALNRAIDLDGLVLRVVRALSRDRRSSRGYETQVRHLLVDEYQDINRAEYELIGILAEGAKSLFVVGDDDQSIYGWRGADPTIIREFQKRFQGAEVQYLEESIRCPEHILESAQAVVSKDPNYMSKPLRSRLGEGARVHFLISPSDSSEARWIANWINDKVSKGSVEPRDIVILCKRTDLADDLVEEIRRRGIRFSYWRSGGLLGSKAVRDILAFIRIFVDRDDNLALRRCIRSHVGKGIGPIGVFKLRHIAEKHQCSLWEVLINANKYEQLGRWRSHFERFTSRISKLHDETNKLKLDEVVHLIAEEIGVSGTSGVDNLQGFARSLPPNTNFQDFLTEAIKNRELDFVGARGSEPEEEEEENAVAVMTMHSAKGLTYDIVFVLGMDEGIFPDPSADENEQRRLCYVAMTRARKELFLCHASTRRGPPARGFSPYRPSRFIWDIPKEHMETLSP